MKFEKLIESVIGHEEHLSDECPVCGKPISGRTRGMFAHRYCEDGHQWWQCSPHDRIYLAKTHEEMDDMTTPMKSSHSNALGCTDECVNSPHKKGIKI